MLVVVGLALWIAAYLWIAGNVLARTNPWPWRGPLSVTVTVIGGALVAAGLST